MNTSIHPFFYVSKTQNGDTCTRGIEKCNLGHMLSSGKYGKKDGIFCNWLWNGSSFSLEIDRYGFYPVYYYVSKDTFAISTTIDKLFELGAPVELDYKALSVFFRLGFFLREDTPFKAIKAIPPCTYFKWKDNELKLNRQWPVNKQKVTDHKTAVSGMVDLFRQSMARRSPGRENIVLPLTGGKDSRHILFELIEMGHSPKCCITTQYRAPIVYDDVSVAANLSELLKIDHKVVYPSPSRLREELRKNILTDFCTDEHSWILPLIEYLSTRGDGIIVYDGIGGDVLSEGGCLDDKVKRLYETGKLRDLSVHLLTNKLCTMSDFILKEMLPRDMYKKVGIEQAILYLEDELQEHVHAANPEGSFFMANRTRREISLCPNKLLSFSNKVFSPYLDHDFFDFMSSLAPSLLMNRQRHLHEEAIDLAYPSFQGIPYAKMNKIFSKNEVNEYKRFASELLMYSYKRKPTSILRHQFLFPRLLRVLVDQRYSKNVNWFGPFALYLTQLDRYCSNDVEIKNYS